MAFSSYDSNPFLDSSNAGLARLMKLINEQGCDRIRQYVTDNLSSGSTLEHELFRKRNVLMNLKANSQKELLYPLPGTSVEQDRLHFGTWYMLARNITKGANKIKWGHFEHCPPGPDLLKQHHDVIRLRNARNELAHPSPSGMDNSGLNMLWAEVGGALERLGTSQTTIRNYYTADVEPTRSFALYVQMKEDVLEDTYAMYKKEVVKRRWMLYGVAAILAALFASVGVLIVFIVKFSYTYTSCSSFIQTIPVAGPGGAIRFMARAGWGADPPRAADKAPQQPCNYTIITNTATIGRCFTTEECCSIVKNTQKLSFTHGYDDINYNFLVGEDAVIYEGRGWDTKGAAARNWNNNSISISIIGNFQKTPPKDDAIEAILQFLQYMAFKNVMSTNFTIYGLCQVRSMFPYAPGAALYQDMKSWHARTTGYSWSWRPRNGSVCESDNQTTLLGTFVGSV